MKINKFLSSFFGSNDIESTSTSQTTDSLQGTIERLQDNLEQTIAKQTFSEQELAQLKAEQEKKDNEAKRQIAKEITSFIKNAQLKPLNEYLVAGYRLNSMELMFLSQRQPHWLHLHSAHTQLQFNFEEPTSIGATEKVNHHLESLAGDHDTDEHLEIKQLQSHIRSYYHTIITESILESLQSFSRVNHVSDYEANTIDLLTNGLKIGVDFLNLYQDILTATQNKEIYEIYSAQLSGLQDKQQQLKYLSTPEVSSSENAAVYQSISTKFDMVLKNLNAHIQEHFTDILKEARQEKLAHIQKLYRKTDTVENLQDNLKSSLSQKIDNFQRKSLPIEAWVRIESIKQEGDSLTEILSQLGQQERFEVENLTKKVLFEAVNEYMAISPKQRAQLKNEAGQGLDEILLESLASIEAQLKTISQNVAQAQFKEVKSTHLYLKAKKT